jgi:hypothetical protein
MQVEIKNIKPNPSNPRIIKDERFAKLVKSLQEFPEMLEKRPLVCYTDTDGKFIVLGGNMRLKAAKEIGLKKLPIVLADDWTAEQKELFILRDNVSGGEWDFEALTEWQVSELEEWGVDVPSFDSEPSYEELIGEEKNKPATMKITFETPEQLQKAEIDIQELLDRKYQGAYFSVSAGEL